MKAVLWKLIHQWRDATTTEAAWIARDQIDIELDKIEAAAGAAPVQQEQASFRTRDAELWLTKNKLATHEILGAAQVQQVFGGRVDPSYVSEPMEEAPKEQAK